MWNGWSSTASLPKDIIIIIICTHQKKRDYLFYCMCEFHPNTPRVRMSRLSTVMKEICTTLRQWPKEEQPCRVNESLSTLVWVQHRVFDPPSVYCRRETFLLPTLSLHWTGVHMWSLSLITAASQGRSIYICSGNDGHAEARGSGCMDK